MGPRFDYATASFAAAWTATRELSEHLAVAALNAAVIGLVSQVTRQTDTNTRDVRFVRTYPV